MHLIIFQQRKTFAPVWRTVHRRTSCPWPQGSRKHNERALRFLVQPRDVPSARKKYTAVLKQLKPVYMHGEHTAVTYGEEEAGLAAEIWPIMRSVNTLERLAGAHLLKLSFPPCPRSTLLLNSTWTWKEKWDLSLSAPWCWWSCRIQSILESGCLSESHQI